MSLSVEVDNPQSRYTNGDTLSGRLILDVPKERLSIRGVTLKTVCDVSTSFTVNMAKKPTDSPSLKLFKSDNRIWEQEDSLELEFFHYRSGKHEIPFTITLPKDRPDLPPSVIQLVEGTTYGNVNYRVKAHAKRTAKSWFGFNDIKAETAFLFMPTGFVDSKVLEQNPLRFEPFNDVLAAQGVPKKKLLDSILRRKPQKQPPLEIQGILSHPEVGLVQNHSAPLELSIQSANKFEEVTTKNVAIMLESWMVLQKDKKSVEWLVKTRTIAEDMITKTGSQIDLNEIASRCFVPPVDIPSFFTETMSNIYRLRIELTLARSNSGADGFMKLNHGFPVTVLSPYLRDIKTGEPLNDTTGKLTTANDAHTNRAPSGANGKGYVPDSKERPSEPAQPNRYADEKSPYGHAHSSEISAVDINEGSSHRPTAGPSTTPTIAQNTTETPEIQNDSAEDAKQSQEDPPDYYEATR